MSGSILYIHGFNSAPASKKACQLVTVMEQLGLSDQLRVPALHHHPREAIGQLEQAIAELGSPLLVGSSLGGYYATHLAERHGLKALLVNPAVSPHRMFDGYLGTQKNLYTDETWESDPRPRHGPGRTGSAGASGCRSAIRCGCRPAMKHWIIASPSSITAPVPCAFRPAATTVSRALPGNCRRC